MPRLSTFGCQAAPVHAAAHSCRHTAPPAPAPRPPALPRRARSRRRRPGAPAAEGAAAVAARAPAPGPDAAVAATSALLLLGFEAEEAAAARAALGPACSGAGVAVLDASGAVLARSVVDTLASLSTLGSLVGSGRCGGTAPEAGRPGADATRAAPGACAQHDEQGHAELLLPASCGGEGRLALLLGPARAALGEAAAWLADARLSAVLAAAQPHHGAWRLADVARAVRAEHERVHELRQPLAHASGAAARVPRGASVALNLALDAGLVVDPGSGELVPDDSRVVVMDGLLTERERGALLSWLTADGWDHRAGPPEARWERACVDREGDAATWGLRPEVQEALRDAPPPEVLALQARLAALYPDFQLCHMPCAAAEPADGWLDDEDEADAPPLSPFVGNAVEAGQACSWYTDFDPFRAPPGSPWEARFGRYGNRQRGKPLCASAILYLNEEWPPEFDAETLFLDPGTGTGALVRPAPGRVALMDADIAHRISPPSALAGQPRYSLVWKLVFFPVERPGRAPPESTLARPEWGPPTRLGSSAGHPVPARGGDQDSAERRHVL